MLFRVLHAFSQGYILEYDIYKRTERLIHIRLVVLQLSEIYQDFLNCIFLKILTSVVPQRVMLLSSTEIKFMLGLVEKQGIHI